MQSNLKIKPILSITLAVIAVSAIIILFGRVLVPFVIALILTYILNPIVEKIHTKLKIKRSIIGVIFATIIFVAFLCIPLILVPSIASQIKTIAQKIPSLLELLNSKVIENINNKYGIGIRYIDLQYIREVVTNNTSNFVNHLSIFSPLAKNSFIIIEVIIYTILVPFILFYTISNWQPLIKFFDELIPRSYRRNFHIVIRDIDKMLSAYLRGQISVMLIMALLYGIGLRIAHVPSGFFIGVITGLLVFIPYIGFSTGFIIAFTLCIANGVSTHNMLIALSVFIIGNLLEGGLVTPYLVGGKIGLNPVLIILALMIFGHLFGFVGVLLALPLSTITVVLLKHLRAYYLKSDYYNE